MIAIIDYGAGNIQSVYKAMKHIGCDAVVTRNKDVIINADGAILPGVGSFGDTMDTMEKYGIKETVLEFIDSGKPFLGICLGLQLLFPESEESAGKKGLAVFDGSITKIPAENGLKIPHIGWNSLDIIKKDGIFKGIEDNAYVYFVHSYFLKATNPDIVAAQTHYGVQIDAAVEYKNVIATQFHPEKSGEVGLKMLKNFADIVNGCQEA
ncbi:MAG: imidazole glycerol phosphate synthase subunit HisH [Ruminococcus sp.]|nr:imidazole glycerol phosphate synthase subunit HisH [Ruminococcus sp.]